MKRKHILSVMLIVSLIYLPFVFRCIQQLLIELNPSDYIVKQAYITDITYSGGHCNVFAIYDYEGQERTEIVLDAIGDCVGKSIILVIHKDTSNVYRKELVIGYQDVSLFIVGVCLLLLENYAYTNKKKRYQQRKMRVLSQQKQREQNMS